MCRIYAALFTNAAMTSLHMQPVAKCTVFQNEHKDSICTSYHMAARAFANLSHDGAKHPSAIN